MEKIDFIAELQIYTKRELFSFYEQRWLNFYLKLS